MPPPAATAPTAEDRSIRHASKRVEPPTPPLSIPERIARTYETQAAEHAEKKKAFLDDVRRMTEKKQPSDTYVEAAKVEDELEFGALAAAKAIRGREKTRTDQAAPK